MVRHNVEKRPFVPRVYQRNVDIEDSLVQPRIADIIRRQGVVYPVSSLVEERVSSIGNISEAWFDIDNCVMHSTASRRYLRSDSASGGAIGFLKEFPEEVPKFLRC